MGDAAEGAHRAGDDDHRVEGIRAAGERGMHGAEVVRDDAGLESEAAVEFLLEHHGGVAAEDDMDFVLGRVEGIEQALGVEGATGSGDSDDDSHGECQVTRVVAAAGTSARSASEVAMAPAVRVTLPEKTGPTVDGHGKGLIEIEEFVGEPELKLGTSPVSVIVWPSTAAVILARSEGVVPGGRASQ